MNAQAEPRSFGRALRADLVSLLGGNTDKDLIAKVVYAFHRLAIAHARMLGRSGRLHAATFQLSVDDLALDCIAGLFSRDEDGRFWELLTYYSRHPIEELDEVTFMRNTRALVSGAFDHALFRCYREHDPSLARLIRSIKRHGMAIDGCYLERINGKIHFCLEKDDPPTPALISDDELEKLLVPHLAERMSLRAALERVIDVLRAGTDYRSAYPVVDLALVIRSATLRLRLDKPFVDNADGDVEDREARMLVDRAVEDVRRSVLVSYGTKDVLNQEEIHACMDAVGAVLTGLWNDSVSSPSLYDALRERLPDLTRTAYRARLRTRCEYFLKQTRQRLAHLYKSEWSDSA